MIKRFATVLLAAAAILSACSPKVEEVLSGAIDGQKSSWVIEAVPKSGGLYTINATVTSDEGWHVYDNGEYVYGPNPTVVTVESLDGGAVLEGELTVSGDLDRYYDDIFDMEIGVYEGSATFSQDIRLVSGGAAVTVTVEWMACNAENCTPLQDGEVRLTIGQPVRQRKGMGELWKLIMEAILWGLMALLTPCVFPMVPMTISFFMKSGDDKAQGRFKALMYGLFIILLYTVPIAILILVTWLTGGDAVTADIFNWLATHWLPNIIFFIVFMIFAASFLGAFEIVLPARLLNSSDSKTSKAGLAGVFFMALTLVLVSFSCTGPIVGTVLIKSTSGEFWVPIITMLAFSTAFALPFVILAMFPSLLKSLPKSGGWLGSVKVILGLVEIALGLKFLSVADQTYHWGILPRDLYLAIWIVVFVLMLLYLLGVISFPSSDRHRKWTWFRGVLCALVAAFVVYLVTGLFGAPLKALSGYLPPMQDKGWFYDHTDRYAEEPSDVDMSEVKYADFLHLPYGLHGYFDLDQAKAHSAATGKPIFLDFTGHGCVNCREMEARVWSDPRVLEILRNDYVICSLYCDDKTVVDEKYWITNDSGKVLKTLGKINSYIGLKDYGCSAQPYYILADCEGKPLCAPRSYSLDVDAFIAFLESPLRK